MEEKEISAENAEKYYGIRTKHGEMPTNGELRFRLICNRDNTAYIRTETKAHAEGWQNSHYHRGLWETYIVQQGSIVFVEFGVAGIVAREYRQGEIFTTEKMIPHNVYMTKNSVIHTLKHGIAEPNPKTGSDWWDSDDAEKCKKLESLKNYSINEVLGKIKQKIEPSETIRKSVIVVLEKRSTKKRFTKVYIHFDKLIWQFPAWLIGLFTIGLMVIGQTQSAQKDKQETILMDIPHFPAFMFFIFAILGAILSFTMYRFRYHQEWEKRESLKRPVSPQALIHVFSNMLITVMFLISWYLSGEELSLAVNFVFVIVVTTLSIAGDIVFQRYISYKKMGNECTGKDKDTGQTQS